MTQQPAVDIEARIHEQRRPIGKVSDAPGTAPVPELLISMTAQSQLYGQASIDKDVYHKLDEQRRQTQKQFEDVRNALTESRTNQLNKEPGIEALNLAEANSHLRKTKQLLEPIIQKLTQSHEKHTNTVNTMISNQQAKLKAHEQSALSSEIRNTVRTLNQTEIDKLFKDTTQPTDHSPEAWAALASPVASLFLTKGQQMRAQSNTLYSLHENFDYVNNMKDIAQKELDSLNKQINTTKDYIATRINTLKQKHPSSFAHLKFAE